MISLQSVFGIAANVDPSTSDSGVRSADTDRVQRLLTELEAVLKISDEEAEQWTAFSNAVLAQMERLTSARSAADSVTWNDPGGDERKRALIKQIIATPVVLSLAARTLYSALTPEQQTVAGEKLLHFHRRLVV